MLQEHVHRDPMLIIQREDLPLETHLDRWISPCCRTYIRWIPMPMDFRIFPHRYFSPFKKHKKNLNIQKIENLRNQQKNQMTKVISSYIFPWKKPMKTCHAIPVPTDAAEDFPPLRSIHARHQVLADGGVAWRTRQRTCVYRSMISDDICVLRFCMSIIYIYTCIHYTRYHSTTTKCVYIYIYFYFFFDYYCLYRYICVYCLNLYVCIYLGNSWYLTNLHEVTLGQLPRTNSDFSEATLRSLWRLRYKRYVFVVLIV